MPEPSALPLCDGGEEPAFYLNRKKKWRQPWREICSCLCSERKYNRASLAPEHMRPRDVVQAWVEAFNRADPDALAALYRPDAVNHQVVESPITGRHAIREMFAAGFKITEMVCIPENLFEDGEWAILEWRDPKGLRGCGFFHVVDGQIVFQRGYWDKLSFLKTRGLTHD